MFTHKTHQVARNAGALVLNFRDWYLKLICYLSFARLCLEKVDE